MPIFEKGDVRTHYEEAGSGFPLLVISGGGLNGKVSSLDTNCPFNPLKLLSDEYRCIGFDQRNADGGESTGPLEVDKGWDSYTEDQLDLLDHLGVDKFMTLGFCIGGPMTWNLLKRASDRIVACVIAQPSGFRPEAPNYFFDNNMKNWGPPLAKRRDDVTMDMVEQFLTNMYRKPADFVFSVDRDFIRNCQKPLLILPDDSVAHPHQVAMEVANAALNAQVSMYPWKTNQTQISQALRHIRTFLKANRPDG